MPNPCPICQRELKKEHKIKFIDYHCTVSKSDHHYARRTTVKGDLIQCKIRFTELDKTRIYLKVQYEEGYSEVWRSPPVRICDRARILYAIPLHFDDIEKLKFKIRTCLVFS
jgi:hypothetical protein